MLSRVGLIHCHYISGLPEYTSNTPLSPSTGLPELQTYNDKTILLPCNATGYPKPKISWLPDPTNKPGHTVTDAGLIIDNVQGVDAYGFVFVVCLFITFLTVYFIVWVSVCKSICANKTIKVTRIFIYDKVDFSIYTMR